MEPTVKQRSSKYSTAIKLTCFLPSSVNISMNCCIYLSLSGAVPSSKQHLLVVHSLRSIYSSPRYRSSAALFMITSRVRCSLPCDKKRKPQIGQVLLMRLLIDTFVLVLIFWWIKNENPFTGYSIPWLATLTLVLKLAHAYKLCRNFDQKWFVALRVAERILILDQKLHD